MRSFSCLWVCAAVLFCLFAACVDSTSHPTQSTAEDDPPVPVATVSASKNGDQGVTDIDVPTSVSQPNYDDLEWSGETQNRTERDHFGLDSEASWRPPTMHQPLPTSVRLTPADRRDYQRTLARLRGHVVFVDFWATWCGPCVRSFPHTVKLHRLGHKYGLRVVTVCLDDPRLRTKVHRFLKSQNATSENLLATSGGSSRVLGEFDIPDGSIPHFKLYDRGGNLRHQWTGAGAAVNSDIRQRITQLLNE